MISPLEPIFREGVRTKGVVVANGGILVVEFGREVKGDLVVALAVANGPRAYPMILIAKVHYRLHRLEGEFPEPSVATVRMLQVVAKETCLVEGGRPPEKSLRHRESDRRPERNRVDRLGATHPALTKMRTTMDRRK